LFALYKPTQQETNTRYFAKTETSSVPDMIPISPGQVKRPSPHVDCKVVFLDFSFFSRFRQTPLFVRSIEWKQSFYTEVLMKPLARLASCSLKSPKWLCCDARQNGNGNKSKNRCCREDKHYLKRPGLGAVYASATNGAVSVLRLLMYGISATHSPG
jgi:hypothetical protein